jgi:hypothetical protein
LEIRDARSPECIEMPHHLVELVVSQLAVPLLLSMSNHTRQAQD